jgi:hypothetical protein
MISRRDLLFGMARRLRESGGDKPVSGIGADIGAADAAYVRKDYAVARDLYKEVLKGNRAHKEARIRQGMCHYHLGEYVQAKDTLLLVTSSTPANTWPVCTWAWPMPGASSSTSAWRSGRALWTGTTSGSCARSTCTAPCFETGEPLTGVEVAEAVENALTQA